MNIIFFEEIFNHFSFDLNLISDSVLFKILKSCSFLSGNKTREAQPEPEKQLKHKVLCILTPKLRVFTFQLT